MADVTGNIGGQPVELNNAATEATLKQLVKAIGILAAKSGGGGAKTQAQIEKELKKFHDQLNKTNTAGTKQNKADQEKLKNTKDLNDAALKEKDARNKTTEAARVAAERTIQFGQGLLNVSKELVSIVNDVANLGNSASSAAGLFSHIPVVGGLMSQTFGAIAAQSEKLLKGFQDAASVGASFGGSINDLTRAASESGMTVDQFGALLAANGEKLALLGQGSSDGAKQLSRMAKDMRSLNSGQTFNELTRLGYSTKDINEGIADYASRLQKTGRLQGMTTEQVAASTAGYMVQLDALSRLTGKNKEALKAEEEQRMKDAQYMAFKRKLDAQGQKELEAIMSSLPAELQEGAKEVLATGTATSDAGKDFLAYMNKTGGRLVELGENARKTGTIQAGTAGQVSKALQAEAKDIADSGTGDTFARFGTDAQKKFMSGVYDAAARQTDLAEVQTQQQKEAAERVKKEKELKDKGLDPAAMVRFQENIAQMSNQMAALLSAHLPTLQTAFGQLAEIIQNVIVPLFQEVLMPVIRFLADNLTAVTAAIVGIGVALKAWKFFNDTKGTRINPMYVRDADLGGVGGPDGDKDKKKKGGKTTGKGKLGGAKGLLKGAAKAAGPLGAVLSLGMMANDLSDVSEQEKSGEITKEEATKKKGGVVGGGLGGAGGAMAGAAIGTMIFPVVGTAIGAAIGGWLGSKGGEVIGEKVGESVAKPGTKVQGTPAAKPATSSGLKVEPAAAGAAAGAAAAQPKPAASTTPSTQIDLPKTMAELNTNMAEMVKLMKQQNSVAQSQLRTTRGMSSDIFVVG